jgi:carbonic anhydrase
MRARQSPIDIPPSAPVHREGLDLDYGTIPLVVGDNPTAVQVDCTVDAAIMLGGIEYCLDQFHIHCPSEHTFGGAHTPMAVHLVHHAADGRIAVVAALFVEGAANPVIAQLLDALEGDRQPREIDLQALLPRDRSHVDYEGSLTTPPYTEGVAWRVLIRPGTLSTAQLAALRVIHDGNARPVQPMGDRHFD